MSAVSFLIDECVVASLLHGVRSRAAYLQVDQVGRPGMPAKRTPDPELLIFCEQHELAIASTDHTTLPEHARNHLLQGRHHWGVFILRPGLSFDVLFDELLLIHGASQAEDWIDQVHYLPF